MARRSADLKYTYLEIINQLPFAFRKDSLDVVRECDPRRELGLSIQHADDLLELRVLYDGERSMAPCNPHGEKEAESRGGVRDTSGIRSDHLGLRCVVRLAHLNVMGEVPGRVLIVHPIDELRRMPENKY